MKRIASFDIDHEKLDRGLYLSRQDGDVVTYDLRMKRPYVQRPLSTAGLHAIEHIGATFLRNSERASEIVYFGPMGCRTGFYLLAKDSIDEKALKDLLQRTFAFISTFEGDIPGCSTKECGNCYDMSLPEGKKEAVAYLQVLEAKKDAPLTY